MTGRAPATFLGIDLAWGERNQTGLAALGADGRLVASTSVRTDDEIAAFVDVHTTATMVAGIDAPLIVPNETGRRPCEAEVTRLFGRYHAGTYPSNRSMPHFTPQPRGARLAERFGWSMDPAEAPQPCRQVCIEVYPHAAMVSLFDLPRVLPYKAKRGRDLTSLKLAYGQLLSHMERALTTLQLGSSMRWSTICEQVGQAARKVDLKAVEDELDAIVCAYVAWLWGTDRSQLVVHGDADVGYIVTPKPPSLSLA